MGVEVFDVVVIGVGVIGVGSVLDVVMCGFLMVLVEVCDFVLGMLSCLSKLIYGGLCYFE